MNKLGVVHSGYKPMIPIGNRICLRFQLNHYQAGDFWNKTMADHDPWCKYIYLYRRTYYEQLLESIKARPHEIFFVLDTPKNHFIGIQEMLGDIISVTRSLGYNKKIIVSAINEPLEHMSRDQIHYLNLKLSEEMHKYPNVYLAVGEMACNFFEYYKSYLDVRYKYDYISFHTDNNCDIYNLFKFVSIFPQGTKLINNEHYYYSGSEEKGYDNTGVVNKFWEYTDLLVNAKDIKSIYICMPFHAKDKGKYPWLGLNTVEPDLKTVNTTKAWKMLKLYDIKEVIEMYLKEQQKDNKGFQVRALQEALNKAIETTLKIDGDFGGKTEAAVIKFNTENNIYPTNVCTYATWYELLHNLSTEVIVMDLIRILKVIE